MSKIRAKARPSLSNKIRAPVTQANLVHFKVKRIDLEGPYGWQNIEQQKLIELVKKLKEIEGMDWSSQQKYSHQISKEKLSKEAQKRLEELNLDDVDELYSLRISGKERVFGIRDREFLEVLWWDPEHVICPSNLKHT